MRGGINEGLIYAKNGLISNKSISNIFYIWADYSILPIRWIC